MGKFWMVALAVVGDSEALDGFLVMRGRGGSLISRG
jgi:hypothetical protein